MAAPKYLKNKTNGRVLPWSPTWAARADMLPCDKNGKVAEGFEPPDEPTEPEDSGLVPSGGNDNPDAIPENPDGEEGGEEENGDELFDSKKIILSDGADVRIDEADADVIREYVERHFGEKIHHATGAEKARDRLRTLIAENGHPDGGI